MQQDTHNCSQCGSPLILVSEVTEVLEGSRFPQTTRTYRCSNQVCQDERDKQAAKRMKELEEKARAQKERLEARLAEKQITQTAAEKKVA